MSPRVVLGPGVALAFLWGGLPPRALLPAPEVGLAGALWPPLGEVVPWRGAEAWAPTLPTPGDGFAIGAWLPSSPTVWGPMGGEGPGPGLGSELGLRSGLGLVSGLG